MSSTRSPRLVWLTVLLASTAVRSTEVAETIDLRNPGITHIAGELRVDLGDTIGGGWQVHSIADITGDGFDEILQIQARDGNCCHDDQPFGGHGVAWLIYGGPDRRRFEGGVPIEDVAGTRLDYFEDGPQFVGICDDAIRGISDLDGDGFGELAIGLCYRTATSGARDAGELLILFGSERLPPVVSLESPSVRHMRFVSDVEDGLLGVDLAANADVNGDGILDFAISGGHHGTENGFRAAGRVDIVFGGFSLDGEIDVDRIGVDVPGTSLLGAFGRDPDGRRESPDLLGASNGAVDGLGDVNGDGIDDLVVASKGANGTAVDSGIVYVLYGNPDLPAEIRMIDPAPWAVSFLGVSGRARTGNSVRGVGDVDGDGLNDVLIGAEFTDQLGEAWLVYGARDWPQRVRLDDPDLRTVRLKGTHPPTESLQFPDVHFGAEVGGLGDLDGDGFAEFFVSDFRRTVEGRRGVGVNYVIRGGPDLSPIILDEEIGGAVDGVRIQGPDADRWLGFYAEGDGDIDGDGRRDLLTISGSFTLERLRPMDSSLFVLWGDELLAERELALDVIEPSARSATGGETVTIRGQGFDGSETVLFGGAPAESVEVANSAVLRATVPRGAQGPVMVEIVRDDARASRDDLFAYGPEREYEDLVLSEDWLDAHGYRHVRVEDFQGSGPPVAPLGNISVRGFLPTYARDLDRDGAEEVIFMEIFLQPFDEFPPRTLILPGTGLPAVIGAGDAVSEGAVVSGGSPGEWLSFRLAFPGDLDGDGYEEIAGGGSLAANRGRGLLLAGRERWAGAIDLGVEAAEGRLETWGAGACPQGTPAALDLDGDGVQDLALGFRNNLCRGSSSSVHLYLGLDGLQDARAPDAIIRGDPTEFSLFGDEFNAGTFGIDVSAVSDANGDGNDDLIIGNECSLMGEFILLLGSDDRHGFFDGSILDYEERGRTVRFRVDRRNSAGAAVDGGFDFNGDGLGDFAVGASRDGRGEEGMVYIVFGSPDLGSVVQHVDLDEDTDRFVRLAGASPRDQVEHTTPIGDYNGDGFDDVAIPATSFSERLARLYVVFGGEDFAGEVIELGNLGTQGFRIVGQDSMIYSGTDQGAVASGDFDGDGARDFALGLSNDARLEGWIVYGKRRGQGFVRGEVNGDGNVDLSDAIFVLDHLFLGGRAPECRDAGDTNDSGAVDLSDAVYLLAHLFLGGPAPPAPYPDAGADPTEDDIDC